MFPINEFEVVDFKDDADFYVINSCSVTQLAEKKTRTAAKQAKKRNPEAKISVIGCYSQLSPEQLKELDYVDIVLGNDDKYNIVEYIKNPQSERAQEVHVAEIGKIKRFVPSYSSGDRTRSFLKVQDGCDHFCTYCSIPMARGRSRSASVEKTIAVAQQAANEGIKEIILTGVNIGDFGKGSDENFFDLVKALEKVNGIERIRISSIEPELLTDEVIEFVLKSDVFLPHFHIPLQSGSDPVLKDMKRFYTTEMYAARVAKIKELDPSACIAADVIIGFPSETDELFNDTMEFIKSIDISYIHTFTYSQRKDTFALRMKEQVPSKEKKRRSQELHKLSEEKKEEFYNNNSGTKHTVLFENSNIEGIMSGWTDNYIKIYANFDQSLLNNIKEVELGEKYEDGFWVNI